MIIDMKHEVQRSSSDLHIIHNPHFTLFIMTLCLCYTKLLFSRFD